jgi:hypothetical protein
VGGGCDKTERSFGTYLIKLLEKSAARIGEIVSAGEKIQTLRANAQSINTSLRLVMFIIGIKIIGGYAAKG